MVESKGSGRSLEEMLQESREKQKAQKLAEQIFGRRSKTPVAPRGKASLGNSLASRVGVSKRPSSLPRTNTAPARDSRTAQQLGRPTATETFRTRNSYAHPSSDLDQNSKDRVLSGNGSADSDGAGVNIRGAATLPNIVVASNFAPGTSAADIESVMLDVGGQMTSCRLLAEKPSVIAEMTFVDKTGAQTVIDTFNNKKADGRLLHVYWKGSEIPLQDTQQPQVPAPEPGNDVMEVDQNTQSREAENRLREERRGPVGRVTRENFPTGPKNGREYEEDYYRGPRRAEAAYQDGRFGFGPSERYGRGGRYREDGRVYSERMGRGGQGWRT